MTRPLLRLEKFDDFVTLTLMRPEKRNALSPELIQDIQDALDQIKRMPEIRGVIVTGEGKAFCAGADLAYLEEISHYDEEQNLQDSRTLTQLFHDLYTLPKITVARVNGPALAGGCGLALCCDYVVADRDKAIFGFTEVKIGFIPAIVMNFLIRKVSLGAAFHAALEGKIFSAEEAQKMGLVHSLFNTTALHDGTLNLLGKLLDQNSFGAMIQTKKLYQELLNKPLEEGLELAARVNAQSRKSVDCQKGLNHFLNKKEIKWREL
ncbi:MAG: enoyl-CoA hydratase/isomerase family protein [Calditrichaeota bacterium]|nr:enoyl-CoA hydratase/isomerase family protein [Calditrichota bacterium]